MRVQINNQRHYEFAANSSRVVAALGSYEPIKVVTKQQYAAMRKLKVDFKLI